MAFGRLKCHLHAICLRLVRSPIKSEFCWLWHLISKLLISKGSWRLSELFWDCKYVMNWLLCSPTLEKKKKEVLTWNYSPCHYMMFTQIIIFVISFKSCSSFLINLCIDNKPWPGKCAECKNHYSCVFIVWVISPEYIKKKNCHVPFPVSYVSQKP